MVELVAPDDATKLPAGAGVQLPDPIVGAYVPAGQYAQLPPDTADAPAGQYRQLAGSRSEPTSTPTRSPNVPSIRPGE